MPLSLSCKCEYVLLALFELAIHYQSGERIQGRQIAARQNIPDRYLEQLLASLKRCGLIRSLRGVNGGYRLAREPQTITLLEVVHCIEGGDSPDREDSCVPETPAEEVIHEVWSEARQSAVSVLQGCTLQDLLDKHAAKQKSGMMYYI